jgi:MOSC domain-containing protein YiiM
MPHIASLVYTPADVERRPPKHYARVAQKRALLRPGHGIEGDAKANDGKRQLNVMLAEDLEQLRARGFRAAPGELGEQLVIAGLEPGVLEVGVRLRLGESAVLEITMPRMGCERFAAVQGTARDAADGRLGFMARVLCGGEVAVGDEVRLEPTDPAVACPSAAAAMPTG